MLEAWAWVESDLHSVYGVDVDDLPNRSWRWLRTRITALAATPGTRLAAALDRAERRSRSEP